MSEHTPGPWRFVIRTDCPNGHVEGIWGPNKKEIVVTDSGYYPPTIADARLIVAAPDMLDLLEEVREFLDNYIDVLDGDDGQPRPNRAMSLDSEIARVLARVRGERWP